MTIVCRISDEGVSNLRPVESIEYTLSWLRVLSGRFLSIHSRYLKALAQQEHQILINMCGHVIHDDRD